MIPRELEQKSQAILYLFTGEEGHRQELPWVDLAQPKVYFPAVNGNQGKSYEAARQEFREIANILMDHPDGETAGMLANFLEKQPDCEVHLPPDLIIEHPEIITYPICETDNPSGVETKYQVCCLVGKRNKSA